MDVKLGLQRADNKPIGPLEAVRSTIRELFPTVQFVWTPSGQELLRLVEAELGEELSGGLREFVETDPSRLEGRYKSSDFFVEFRLGHEDPVKYLGVTLRGECAQLDESLCALEARFGGRFVIWGTRHFEDLKEAPRRCPRCGGPRLARVLWNCAYSDVRDQEDIQQGRAILVSCVLEYFKTRQEDRDAREPESRTVPDSVCLTCEPRWSELQRYSLQYHKWQMAKEDAILSKDFEAAARAREVQVAMGPQLRALVDELLAQ
jgi:hypothetical protein